MRQYQIDKVRSLKAADQGEGAGKGISVRGANGAVIGQLTAIDEKLIDDQLVWEALTSWRKRFKLSFLTQFEPTIERTRKWLRDVVLKDDTRALFLISDNSGKIIGNIGVCNITGDQAELDNVLRGEKVEVANFMFYVETAMLNWLYDEMGVDLVVLHVFSNNTKAINLYTRAGFGERQRFNLSKVQEGDEVKHLVGSDKGDPVDFQYIEMVLEKIHFKSFIDVNINIPKVSIGMPVYNGEKNIREALDSLLAQTFTDFELIISDNASTDRTGEICLEYAKKDPHIHYVRQPENKGAGFNFQFVLDNARGEYFMWAAHDDVRSPDYVAVNVDFLCRNPDFVASTSPVRFNDGEFDEIRMGDRSLVGDMPQRIVRFFGGGFICGRFYSLMRRDLIKDYPVADVYLGSDLALVLYLASKGELNRTSQGWVVLGRTGLSCSKDIFRIYRKSLAYFFFPFFRLSLYALELSKVLSIRDRIKIVWALLKMNLKGFILQFLVLLRRF